MKLSCFTYTNRGGRPDNEDSVRWDCQDGRGIFVLADGLGGHRSGEMASAIAAETILTGISEASALDEQLLAEQLEAANLQVMEGQKHPGCEDMKTTAVVLAAEVPTPGRWRFGAMWEIPGSTIFPAGSCARSPGTTPSPT